MGRARPMHIADILRRKPTFSFEFFPPKTAEAFESLFSTIADLQALNPAFVSVTYGAGGSTRDLTHDLVVRLKQQTPLEPIPHLTCVCHHQQDIESILQRYAEAGVGNILALGGDPPRDRHNHDRSLDAFRHAADLVRFIRQFKGHSDPRGFGIGVAGFPEGHPATPNRLLEMDHLKAKCDAGADYICTQLFFDNHDFLDFRDRCRLAGIEQPIIAGIMPITSLSGIQRMAELAAGTHYPAKLLRRLQAAGQDEAALAAAGVQYAGEQCQELLREGVDGIHFYTLNKSQATREIYRHLGMPHSAAIAS